MERNEQNLAPPFNSEEWKCWTPNERLSPVFERETDTQGTMLHIHAAGVKQNFGKWVCDVPYIIPGRHYNACVDYRCKNVEIKEFSIYSMISWLNESGDATRREYIDHSEQRIEDGWTRVKKTVQAPYDAAKCRIELAFQESAKGSVSFRGPILQETIPLPQRLVKVAAAGFTRKNSREENVETMLSLIDQAVLERPGLDIIAFAEFAFDRGINLPLYERASKLPCELTNKFAEKARQLACHIIINLVEEDGRFFYNTSVLFGRDGRITGKYRKTHLPVNEREMGISSGDEFPVFDLDFGKIGLLICFDMRYFEASRILKRKGAEMVFVSTIGYFPTQASQFATENGLYIITAGCDGKEPCSILNPLGEKMSGTVYGTDSIAYAEIDLSQGCYRKGNMAVGPATGEARTMIIRNRRPDLYALPPDDSENKN